MVVKLKEKQDAKNKNLVTQHIRSQGNVSLEKGGLMELLK